MASVRIPGSAGLPPELLRDYRRHLVGAILFGLAGVLVLGERLLALPTSPRDALPWAAYGFPGCILLLMGVLLARAAHWYHRCAHVQRHRSANPMRMRIARNRSGGMFLELFKLSDTRFGEMQHRTQLQPPAWDTSPLEGQIVRVRMDEDPTGPIVVDTDRGTLWPVPYGLRQNQPKEPLLA